MAKRQVGLKLEEELLDEIEAARGSLSRTTFIESVLWRALRPVDNTIRGDSEPVIPAPPEPQGRTIDPYPSAPMDPAARREWTARRAAGWAPFGLPAAQANAELIAQQKRTEGK